MLVAQTSIALAARDHLAGRPGGDGDQVVATPPGFRARFADIVARDAIDELPTIARGPRSTVARLVVDDARYVVKRYHEPGAFLWRTFLRASRAHRELDALALVCAAVPNPVQPVAWAEDRRLGLVPRSWVVTNELAHASNLRGLKGLEGAARAAAVALVLDVLPGRVAALHAARIFARNLHAKNVLVAPETGALAFIDLPHAGRVATLGRRRRVHDLACLWKELRRSLEADERRRFFEGYARAAGLEDGAALEDLVVARADILDNRTPLAGAIHRARRALRHSRLGRWVTGRAPGPGSPA